MALCFARLSGFFARVDARAALRTGCSTGMTRCDATFAACGSEEPGGLMFFACVDDRVDGMSTGT